MRKFESVLAVVSPIILFVFFVYAFWQYEHYSVVIEGVVFDTEYNQRSDVTYVGFIGNESYWFKGEHQFEVGARYRITISSLAWGARVYKIEKVN
jgi:hypothetical protein